MIYMTGSRSPTADAAKTEQGLDLMLGLMITPATAQYIEGYGIYNWTSWDNGGYTHRGRERLAKIVHPAIVVQDGATMDSQRPSPKGDGLRKG